ncbi:MAG: sigma-70 family RNA polymerase sigma factor [Planctomycetes bacterium]|nr:sigma-70 family RNA polymerase sigma factor [Planctomycetota bacterium]
MAEHPNPWRETIGGQVGRTLPLEDLAVIERVKEGRTEAYGKLVLKYQDRVFNACWRICGHLDDARDYTQDAFVKALENIDSFRAQSGFYTWIFRIAVNLALSGRRKAATQQMRSLDQIADASGTQAAALVAYKNHSDAAGSLDTGGDTDARQAIIRALNSLDKDHRAVIVLRDIEGMNYQEVGEILDIPVGTVRSRLHRGRMALRESFLATQRRRDLDE